MALNKRDPLRTSFFILLIYGRKHGLLVFHDNFVPELGASYLTTLLLSLLRTIHPATACVSQGSVLSSTWWLVNINDLVFSASYLIQNYADDCHFTLLSSICTAPHNLTWLQQKSHSFSLHTNQLGLGQQKSNVIQCLKDSFLQCLPGLYWSILPEGTRIEQRLFSLTLLVAKN